MSAQEDDGFRQIELSGKQLVFLVMAATTVLAVSFMLGMLVGRGVRAEREEAANIESFEAASPTPRPDDPPAANPFQGQTPPEPVQEEPFPDAVARSGASSNTDKQASSATKAPETSAPKAVEPPAAKPADKPAAGPAEKPAERAAAPSKPTEDAPSKSQASQQVARTTPAPAASVATSRPPMPQAAANGSGYAVQVAAVNERSEADAIVKRLSGKGYAAYVETPKGGASVYRVRVGTFESRRDAQAVADRLTKEERFKPWVTR